MLKRLLQGKFTAGLLILAITAASLLPSLTAYAAILVAPGSVWTGYAATEENSWRSLAYGNNTYVAVAGTGTNRVMTSPDGVTWTAQSAVENRMWVSVAYGNGVFVAVGFNSTPGHPDIMTSPDGVTWTAQSVGTTINWNAVIYANGMFVAIPNPSDDAIYTSPDGVTWTAQSSSRSIQLSSITYGNGMFVAVAYAGIGGRVMTSPDGITWTQRTIPENNDWRSVAYGNGRFVAVGNNGAHQAMTSVDGITWTAQSAAENNFWASLVYANGTFVAVAANGTNRVMTSIDGVSWTAYAAAENNSWQHVNYVNGRFIALAVSGTNQVMISISGHDLDLGNPDFSSSPNSPGDTTASVLTNSEVLSTGDAVESSDYALSIIDNGGLDGVTINPDGTLSIPSNAPTGTYTITYTACENAFPDYCEQASVTLAVQGTTLPMQPSNNSDANTSLAQTGASQLLFATLGVLLLAFGLTLRRTQRTNL